MKSIFLASVLTAMNLFASTAQACIGGETKVGANIRLTGDRIYVKGQDESGFRSLRAIENGVVFRAKNEAGERTYLVRVLETAETTDGTGRTFASLYEVKKDDGKDPGIVVIIYMGYGSNGQAMRGMKATLDVDHLPEEAPYSAQSFDGDTPAKIGDRPVYKSGC